MRLISERRASACSEIIVVLGDAILAAIDAPENNGDAAEKDRTADTANDTADDFLVALAEAAAAVVAVAILRKGHFRCGGRARGDQVGRRSGRARLKGAAIANGGVDGYVFLDIS